ncbi:MULTISPECIES: GNAT family N-acetyltransferase [Rhodanobacter]|uniref:GNAT family N-acetyltransferase n=1 Tax=Rhodanobacter TaxID=75309 RepID=UPI00041C78C5|nr:MULTISPECIES: GNAT family N-acetyltransferase [Rhodanobacter]UJJ60122.1 GNAT family N-acetyltransferase [Rhodanobacter denitrificans]
MPTALPPPSPAHGRRIAAGPADLPSATSGPRVRRAAASDLDELVALEQRSFSSDRLSRAQYRRHLDSDSALVLVASANHHLFLGSAVLFFRKRSAVARLYSLATAPEARGQGVGAALLAAVADAARRRGSRALKLEVRTDNAAAIRLYERHGFRRIGRYARYYEDGADAWRYEQTLD